MGINELKIDDNIVKIEIADGWFKRFRGLSGRSSLNGIDGMLFTFPWPAKWEMCMRGMRFPLDFVWLKRGKVIGVSENVSFGAVAPTERVDSVLELPAGRAAELNISVRSEISLECDPTL